MLKFVKIFNRFKKECEENPDDTEEDIYTQIKAECPILYKSKGYWACGKGWYDILTSLSYKVEALHEQYYKKYRIRVEFQEIKEKWSSLNIYYSVIADQSKFIVLLSSFFDFIAEKLDTLNYKMVEVEDCPYYINHIENEISKKEYNKEIKKSMQCSNVKFFERDKKYYKVVDYENYRKYHLEPSQLKILYKLKKKCNEITRSLLFKEVKMNNRRKMIKGYISSLVEQYVKNAEHEAEYTCELCGQRIGEDWSPICETAGWIRKLCKRCAEEQDSQYYMNGNLLYKGKIVKTKKQIKLERKKYESKK